MNSLCDLKVKIFADGADKEGMRRFYADPLIRGLTTNPTLMNKAGIRDYERFAKEVLEFVREKPISFEVFTDEFGEMRRQALKIGRWQDNIYVKIPVTNTRGESSDDLIRELVREGVKINVTAVLTLEQIRKIVEVFDQDVPSIISIFAGRIADTGRDPTTIIRSGLELVRPLPKTELLWGSVREALNIFQAEQCGCDIVTVPHEILKRAIQFYGMDLSDLSLETVRMFWKDAQDGGFRL